MLGARLYKASAKGSAAATRQAIKDAGVAARDFTADKWDAVLLDLWADAEAARAVEQINFLAALIDRLEVEGRPYTTPADGAPPSGVGRAALTTTDESFLEADWKNARKRVKSMREQAILDAADIDGRTALRLKRSYELSPEERAQLLRYGLRKFYGVGETPDVGIDRRLVKEDRPSRRRSLRRLAIAMALTKNDEVASAALDAEDLSYGLTYRCAARRQKTILLIDDHLGDDWGIRDPLTYGKTYTTAEIEFRYLVLCEQYGGEEQFIDRRIRPVAQVLGVQVPRDIREKPISWIGTLLRALALRQRVVKQPRTEGGGRTRVYMIDGKARERALLLAQAELRRMEKYARDDLAQPAGSGIDSREGCATGPAGVALDATDASPDGGGRASPGEIGAVGVRKRQPPGT